jgi:hypothetical protein
MALLSDIVKQEIVAKMDGKITVTFVVSVVDNLDGTFTSKVKFCNYKWLRFYLGKTVDGKSIQSITNDVVDVAYSEPLQIGSVITLPIPLFFHGTPLNTVLEWHNFAGGDENSKLPFIWLVEPVNEKYNDPHKTIKRVASCKLLFVHFSDWSELNQFRVNESIKPLSAVCDEFERTVDNNRIAFDRIKERDRKEFPKFGKESPKGVEQTIFNTTLAAVQLTLRLEIKANCLNC